MSRLDTQTSRTGRGAAQCIVAVKNMTSAGRRTHRRCDGLGQPRWRTSGAIVSDQDMISRSRPDQCTRNDLSYNSTSGCSRPVRSVRPIRGPWILLSLRATQPCSSAPPKRSEPLGVKEEQISLDHLDVPECQRRLSGTASDHIEALRAPFGQTTRHTHFSFHGPGAGLETFCAGGW